MTHFYKTTALALHPGLGQTIQGLGSDNPNMITPNLKMLAELAKDPSQVKALIDCDVISAIATLAEKISDRTTINKHDRSVRKMWEKSGVKKALRELLTQLTNTLLKSGTPQPLSSPRPKRAPKGYQVLPAPSPSVLNLGAAAAEPLPESLADTRAAFIRTITSRLGMDNFSALKPTVLSCLDEKNRARFAPDDVNAAQEKFEQVSSQVCSSRLKDYNLY